MSTKERSEVLVDYRFDILEGAVAAHADDVAGERENAFCVAACGRYTLMTGFLPTLRASIVDTVRARTERIVRQWIGG